jgi:endoglucanase
MRKPGLRLQQMTRKKVIQPLSTVGTFLVLTLAFTALFSTVTDGVPVSSPDRTIALASTKDKSGVTAPEGTPASTQDTVEAGEQTVLGATSLKIATPTSIPSKPSWVNMPLYVDPANTASQYANANPTAEGVDYIRRMGQVPVAEWFGDWNSDVQGAVNSYVSKATTSGAVPAVVLYNIPLRDCGGYSVGGAAGVQVYTQWVQKVVAGIGNRTAVVIVEPDALGALDCLPASAQNDRLQSISQGVALLKTLPKTSVYIDAGTPVWQPAKVMATRLKQANVAQAEGFSLNISYFASTSQNRVYGDSLSSMIGNKHYVIDTSRNGGNNSPTGMQCNPSFASLGQTPTTSTGSARNDALLWIKIPWESDGQCGDSPGPGVGYWSYAISMAIKAGW